MDTMSEPGPANACSSVGSRPHRLKKRSRSVPAREKRSLMSDLERVSEGRFLELEEERRVTVGEPGGSTRGSERSSTAAVEGGRMRSCGGGAGTGFKGEDPEVVLEW